MVVPPNTKTNTESQAEWEDRETSSNRMNNKISEEQPNEMEKSNMPDKAFKVMIIKILTVLQKKSERFQWDSVRS